MSESQNDVVHQSENSRTESETTENLSRAEVSYKEDMHRFKERANRLEEQLKEIELDKQQKSGNLEGVISSLKDEIKGLKHTNATNKLSYAETQLDSKIREELSMRDLKGKKLDAFMKLIDDNDKSIVELDEKFNVNHEDIKSLVDKNMERYGDLFKKEVKFVDGVPNNNATPTGKKEVDVTKMTWEQAKEYMKTLKD